MIYKKETIKEHIKDRDLLKLNREYHKPSNDVELLKITRIINSCETLLQLNNVYKWIIYKIKTSKIYCSHYNFIYLHLQDKLNDLTDK